MTVSRIEITDIKGVAYCELKLAGRTLTVLKGANAVGKSSVLHAIQSVFEGGSDPGLVRHGAKSAKVVLELSDGTVIKKAQTAKGAQLVVTTADGTIVPSPQSYVAGLAKSFAFNPLEFLKAPKKDRAEFLLKAMPIEFTGKEIGGLKFGQLDAAEPLRELVKPDAKLNLAEFDKLRTTVYERRRNANAAVKELDATVTNLRRSVPESVEGGVGLEDALAIAQGRLAELDKAEKADLAFIDGQVADAKATARKNYEHAVEMARAARDAELADIDAGAAEALAGVRQERAGSREELQRAIGEAQGNLKRVGEIQALKSHLETQQGRLSDKANEADALDKALGALDDLKRSKLDKLPVAGLEIRDGEVYRDGVPFDHLNQARQYFTAVEIGCLGLGDLPLVLCDEREHLDAQQAEEFDAALKDSGLQVIMAEVSEGPLRSEPQGALKL